MEKTKHALLTHNGQCAWLTFHFVSPTSGAGVDFEDMIVQVVLPSCAVYNIRVYLPTLVELG